MKKLLITSLGVLMLSSLSTAQTTSEIYQLSRTQNLGSARYNALSGAFGALGGDLTAIAENPAASAVFLNSYGSFTLGYNRANFDASYFGNNITTQDNNLNFNQIGGVLVLKDNNSDGSGLSKLSLAVVYNQDNDYRESFTIRGNANNSIADFFVNQANGIPVNALIARGNGSLDGLQRDFNRIGDSFGIGGQRAFLGFQGRVINDSNNSEYVPGVTGGNTNQTIVYDTNGDSSKVSFNLAGEFNETFYIGVNFNIHDYNYRKSISFRESNGNSADDVQFIEYRNDIFTFGNGYSLGIGAITKLGDQLRAGFSYQSPTWNEFEDELDQRIFVEENINNSLENNTVDPETVVLFPAYRFRTPGVISGSLAYVFGKNGLISAQYSRQDFSNIEYTTNTQEFAEANARINETFQAVNTFKIGAEYRYNKWRFRGGASTASSPYKDSNINGDSTGFSLGTGYDWGKWKFDLAYNNLEINRNESFFENPDFQNNSDISKRQNIFTATLGLNF